jgi:hypothetical protein
MARRIWLGSLALLLPPALGCGGDIEVPRIDPKSASDKALAAYDTNGDGFLDDEELTRCPGLKSCLARLDTDMDGRLSRSEIEECLIVQQRSKVGLMEVLCKVTLGGKPLAGANITLEPEAFLGSNIKSAAGTTDERGQARLRTQDAPLSGCNLGIFRVRISKRDSQGNEALPPCYNTQTELGVEVSPEKRGQYLFHLASNSEGDGP